MSNLLYHLKKLLPAPFLSFIRPPYHFLLSFAGAVRYRHPSKDLTVIGITGTKGKSTTTELVAALLTGAGYKVATLSTIRFTYGDREEKNLFKMTLPGRFFLQKFLRTAVEEECTFAVVELTSEGAKQFRHRFLELDALIFTNLSPEHIESHGSFEKYKEAKLEIAKQLTRSKKRPRYIVANTDDEHGKYFLATKVEHQLPYALTDVKFYNLQKDGFSIIFDEDGGDVTVRVPLVGLFNIYNTLAAITLARALGVKLTSIENSLRHLPPVRGRVEQFKSRPDAKKPVTAVVDYAHTPDSLTKLYQSFKDQPKVCVLGNTGGGRDTWKRPEMGRIAEHYCDVIILTNEDPYDEDPHEIVDQMLSGMSEEAPVEVIMDRREAIKTALKKAAKNGYVLISGKGTDPYIMGPNNTKEPWSDAEVVKEELAAME